jgi:hypothetical protein
VKGRLHHRDKYAGHVLEGRGRRERDCGWGEEDLDADDGVGVSDTDDCRVRKVVGTYEREIERTKMVGRARISSRTSIV